MTREFPVRAMTRATGAAQLGGNRVHLQFDGPSTFDAWKEAIHGARRYVHFENYILRNDGVGREFRALLSQKAREGVEVRVLHDWVGCWATPRRYWRPYREAGVEVRAFNRPSLRDPLGLLQRDHRKLVCVDGEVAFLGGFCVGDEWAGVREQAPWRDTGVEIRGPAAAAAARAFERIWEEVGDPVPEYLRAHPERTEPVGETPAWIIEGEPWMSRVYRATQLVASWARERLWITDAYFVAPRPVQEALAAAARDGVDVRILVPAHNNWPWVGSLSRGGYRVLLEAGVRIFEWQGPMIHAKTAVADSTWCRVGSSNLNAASLLGNWEMDVGVLDPGLARAMEGLFLADLASSVEIVLPGRRLVVSGVGPEGAVPAAASGPEPRVASLDPEGTFQERLEIWMGEGGTVHGFRMADLVRAGSSLGEAIAGRRTLGREDRTVLGTLSVFFLILSGIAILVPRWVGWFVAGVLAWLGLVGGLRTVSQRWLSRRRRGSSS